MNDDSRKNIEQPVNVIDVADDVAWVERAARNPGTPQPANVNAEPGRRRVLKQALAAAAAIVSGWTEAKVSFPSQTRSRCSIANSV